MDSKILRIVLISFITHCYAEDRDLSLNPIYEGPKYVKEGSPFEISCFTTENQNPEWSILPRNDSGWNVARKAAGEPSESLPGTIERYLYLKFGRATSADAGNYTCHSSSKTYHEIIIINEILTPTELTDGAYVIHLYEKFQLYCNLTTTPDDVSAVGVEWYLDGEKLESSSRIEFLSNNTLSIEEALETDCGLYTCSANISDVDYNNTIFVQSKPYMESSFEGASMNKVEGEDLHVNCTAYGMPKPQIYWLKDGVNISDSNNSRYVIDGASGTSYFTILKLEETDRAIYACLAVNPFGRSEKDILVRVKDKLAALWPFLGIVAEVAVLCTIIFIYEKRRAKQEFDESDTDQSPDTKNVSENKDVRQRK